ncbi:uncharacterized protein LOC111900429 [Lactuca sativa]|uniref:uncharacterized protein LOC111900429 n=1 Tax=Lactuca sativa TaxID=4236 RepID=UPI0022AE8D22|nr:uncharacterized protein LOC111900429 [Lactuca sativa]
MSSSSSSDSTTVEEAKFIGSVMAKTVAYCQNRLGETSRARPNLRKSPLRRNHEAGHDRLIEDYFADDAVYAVKFRRRFRMRKELFLRIVGDLEGRFPYFQWKMDARGKKGFSPIQKCTASIRQLAYDMGADKWDNYFRMSVRTVRDSVYKFCKAICLVYGQRYLRKPTINDIHQLYTVHEGKHGFPGMLGSVDCMHWSWALCPNAWRAGANNDINVLDQSPIFNDIYLGKSHDVPFQANRIAYKCGYYLTDGIYLPLSVFVKSFTCPNDPKRKKFKEAQESARKDVERAFGVLKRHWQVLTVGARSYEVKRLRHVMYACIILHNMILEDEGRAICRYNENEVLPNVEGVAVGTQEYRVNRRKVHNRDLHQALRADLVEHIYRAYVHPPQELSYDDDLFDESDEDSHMFVESEDSDNESDAGENDADDVGEDEDDDSE